MNKIILFILFASFLMNCDAPTYKQGERIYDNLCSNCHMKDGKGLNKLIPDLESGIQKHSIKNQICIIVNGINADSLGMSMKVMPAFDQLSDAELTNLSNYINSRWNSQFEEQSMMTIQRVKGICQKEKD